MTQEAQKGFKGFLKRKNIEISIQRYLIDALSAMAAGLFSSLLIGTILNTIGQQLGISFFTDVVAPMASQMTGPAIGVAIASALKSPAYVIYACTIVGFSGNNLGGPVGAFVATIIAAEVGKMVSKETKVDLIVTPATTIIVGVFIGELIGPGISAFMLKIGELIMLATNLQPILMGMLVSIIVGITLTLPISSAAICIMLNLGGLAGGAATAGCCAQMVGLAAMSYKENGIGGVVSVGLGTSMLQVPNIVRNWKIWIPPIVAAAITGPISTVIMKMENIPIGSGMGTSGLVGQIGTITAMNEIGRGGPSLYINMFILHFVLPVVISLVLTKILKKIGWIKEGDLTMDL